MAGVTHSICFQTLQLQWESHSAMAAICTHWSITKDQLIRLKTKVPLAPRHDRRLRFKPKRSECRDPSPSEIVEACKRIQLSWDAKTEEERRVTKASAFKIRESRTPDELQDTPDDVRRWWDAGE